MNRLLRAEFLKLTTIWSTYVILAITALASGLLGLVIALAPHPHGAAALLWPSRGTPAWFDNVFSAMSIAQDLALVLGILIVTGEYRHRTATSTYLAEPRRGKVTAAKLVASLVGGASAGVAAGVAGLALGAALVASGYGYGGAMLTEFRHVFPGVAAAAVLFGLYGSALGALLRNQVVALVVGLGVTAVVEPIIVGVWPSIGQWLPSQAARSLESVAATATSGGFGSLSHLLPWWQGALVLVAYGVVLAAAGSLTTVQADVT